MMALLEKRVQGHKYPGPEISGMKQANLGRMLCYSIILALLNGSLSHAVAADDFRDTEADRPHDNSAKDIDHGVLNHRSDETTG